MPRPIQSEVQLVGRTVAGKYKLAAVQACGAFGTVFLAHQHFCGHFVRPVAVKISRQTGLTEASAPLLFSDALVLAQLLAGPHREGKQHLVPIHDMGLLPEHDDRGFLVMEHVDGYPLLSHIRAAGRIGVATGLRYFREICRALALVHAQGAVHRDLKPDNILVDRAGVVRVVDFGLAAFTDPRLGFAPGSMGTFTYMAPETLLGKAAPAADVYGLGLVAYEMFTGGGPHLTAPWPRPDQERDGDYHYRIKTGLRFAPPSEVHNEIRNDFRWLDEVILRCLEVDPNRRFADAGQMLEALDSCQAGRELTSALNAPTSSPAGTNDPFADVSSGHRPEPALEETLISKARRLLGCQAYAEVIDLLDIHRPVEWAVVNLEGMRILRILGQAYRGKGDWRNAVDCLVQLRDQQKEQALLPRQEYLAALTELKKCWQTLGHDLSVEECRQEMQKHALLS